MKIDIPDKVDYIINKLIEHGYEAYAVGGCVRDSILGRIPGDWDITTSASPYEVKEIFRRTIDTGIQHGTVTIMIDKEGFEVTTYRLDGEYEDNRHPKQVEFTKSLEEDLKRRDFTINAMAYNRKDGMVDLFDGCGDLERKVIRCVGSPEERFQEDALRILRAVRFSAQLNFEIEAETKKAIIKKKPNLASISAERVREELNKLLLSAYPNRLKVLYETGISDIVLPEFSQQMKIQQEGLDHIIGDEILEMLQLLSEKRSYEWYMMNAKTYTGSERVLDKKEVLAISYASIISFHNVLSLRAEIKKDSSIKQIRDELADEREMKYAIEVMKRLKFDNDTIQLVGKLVKFSHVKIEEDITAVRKAIHIMGMHVFGVWYAFSYIRELVFLKEGIRDEFKSLEQIYQYYRKICETKECVDLKMLAYNGKMIMDLGVKPGRALGELLEVLLEHVLNHPHDNTEEKLRELVLSRIKA